MSVSFTRLTDLNRNTINRITTDIVDELFTERRPQALEDQRNNYVLGR